MALLQPGDTFLGMSLAAGGHLTHGAAPNQSGKWFNAIQYGVREEDGLIDFDEVEALANEHKPKLIIAGGSAYPRIIDFERFRQIADEVGAYFMVDMAHFAGLVAGGVHPNPLPHADVVTTTTHKTLRGGARRHDPDQRPGSIGKKINSAVFPGLQGGPLMHAIAAKGGGLRRGAASGLQGICRPVVENAAPSPPADRGRLRHRLRRHRHPSDAGRPASQRPDRQHRRGWRSERAGITCNKNGIPFDPEKPMVTSGVRLGTPAATTRGFGPAEFRLIVGELIVEVLGRAGGRKHADDDNRGAGKVRRGRGSRGRQAPLCGRVPDLCQRL